MDCLIMTTGCTSARSQLLVMGMAAMTVFLAMTLFLSPLQYPEAAEVECVLPIPTEMRVCVNCPVPEGSAAATAVPSISNGDCTVVMILYQQGRKSKSNATNWVKEQAVRSGTRCVALMPVLE
ncbi:unnamed protein product [Sphagnum troendelagicum]|uniref:Uncharacterized protein n=1 Tax=Sphagnum troendelagicum TaxID=128251 RepID=A0ABP0TTE2_9BRYO